MKLSCWEFIDVLRKWFQTFLVFLLDLKIFEKNGGGVYNLKKNVKDLFFLRVNSFITCNLLLKIFLLSGYLVINGVPYMLFLMSAM